MFPQNLVIPFLKTSELPGFKCQIILDAIIYEAMLNAENNDFAWRVQRYIGDNKAVEK